MASRSLSDAIQRISDDARRHKFDGFEDRLRAVDREMADAMSAAFENGGDAVVNKVLALMETVATVKTLYCESMGYTDKQLNDILERRSSPAAVVRGVPVAGVPKQVDVHLELAKLESTIRETIYDCLPTALEALKDTDVVTMADFSTDSNVQPYWLPALGQLHLTRTEPAEKLMPASATPMMENVAKFHKENPTYNVPGLLTYYLALPGLRQKVGELSDPQMRLLQAALLGRIEKKYPTLPPATTASMKALAEGLIAAVKAIWDTATFDHMMREMQDMFHAFTETTWEETGVGSTVKIDTHVPERPELPDIETDTRPRAGSGASSQNGLSNASSPYYTSDDD